MLYRIFYDDLILFSSSIKSVEIIKNYIFIGMYTMRMLEGAGNGTGSSIGGSSSGALSQGCLLYTSVVYKWGCWLASGSTKWLHMCNSMTASIPRQYLRMELTF